MIAVADRNSMRVSRDEPDFLQRIFAPGRGFFFNGIPDFRAVPFAE